MNKTKIIILSAAAIAVALCVSPYMYSFIHRDDWKQNTSPLPKGTISTLCKSLLLNEANTLCNGSKTVYAADFNAALRARFPLKDPMETPKNEALVTSQEVDKAIGQFKIECQDIVHESNYSYYRCFYDFRGDGFWKDVFYFYFPEQTLFSIRSSSTQDD
jgi:hypothetical protein